jgi:hypothetical protein
VHRLVQTLVTCKLGHLQGLARVRDHRGRVVREPCGLDGRARVLVDPGAVPLGELRPRDAFRRVLGMQVERKPLDAGAEPALQPVGPLQADEAERSDVVAPDGYRKSRHFHSHQ